VGLAKRSLESQIRFPQIRVRELFQGSREETDFRAEKITRREEIARVVIQPLMQGKDPSSEGVCVQTRKEGGVVSIGQRDNPNKKDRKGQFSDA